MGKRGPPKTPTAILNKRGSRLPEHRPDEARFGDKVPKPPVWLRNRAKEAWEELVPHLAAVPGLLKTIDRNALSRYCQNWAKWRECEEFLDKNGNMYAVKDKEGNVTDMKQFPQVNTAIKLGAQLDAFEKQFGMTASARASLSIDDTLPPMSDADRMIHDALNRGN